MALRLRNITSAARALLGIVSSRWVFSGPRSVALAISDPCNTNCLMCWRHSPLLRETAAPGDRKHTRPASHRWAYMDSALFEMILRESREIGTFRVVIGGNGDPALHPRFDRMLERTVQLGMEPYVLTNGLIADEKRARVWATIDAHFRFSVHAGDEETWLRVHPGGTSKQFAGLSRLIKLLAAARTPQVSTINVIHKANFRHVREMMEYAHRLGVPDVLFRPVRAEGDLAQLTLDPEEEAELHRDLKYCLRLGQSYGIRTNLREYLANNLYIRKGVPQTERLYRSIPCYIGWIYAEFDIDGVMTPCLHSKIIMGRAGKQRIRDMWLSPRYRAFRRETRSMPRRGEPVRGCECEACCMAKYNINIHNLLCLKSLAYRGT